MISIRIRGLKEIETKLARFPRYLKAVQREFSRAASEVVLADQGGGKPFYPPETEANKPPPPYYERGFGMHYVGGGVRASSEQMDRRFVTDTNGWMTRIQNTASYSPYVIGEDQTDVMEYIGWQKLIDVARKGKKAIMERWDDIVRRTLKKVGLKVK